MISALAEFHFLRPLWLLLLLAIPLFLLLRHRGRADAGAWRAAVDPHLLPHLIERIDTGGGRSGAMLAVALCTLASVALAGPAWEREPVPLYRNQAARVLALELSATMLAQDAKPSRFERARYKLVDMLERSRDYQTALIGYAGEAFVAAPLTDDIGTVRALVDALDPSTMPVAGNRASRAIEQAEDLIHQAGLHAGEIILLADDVDDAAIAAARKAASQGLKVSVLGIGSATGAPVPLAQGDFLKDDHGDVIVSRLDDAGLRALADAGGGRYATLTADARDIDSLLADRTHAVADAQKTGANDDLAASTRWRDRGPWLLLLLVPLAAFAFRRGWLMAFAFAALLPSPRAEAASFQDLWLRSDQQAAAALAQGDAKKAASVAHSPEWRGSAAYRDGNFESAAGDYAKADGADGAYNEGNALAKLGRYDDAIAAYDRALKLAPEMDDAKANKSAVEEWLKQQQKQQNDSSQQRKSKSGDSKNQKSDDNKSPGDKNQQEQNDQQNSDNASSENRDDKQDGESSQDSPEKQDSSQQDTERGQNDEKQDSSSPSTSGDTAEPQAQTGESAGAPSGEQQKALTEAIDKSLASEAKPGKNGEPAGVAQEDDAAQEKRQALEHLLQRVPDDPGGLLRRKFLLEYQRRQQRGGEGG